jgi:hypothetical protein
MQNPQWDICHEHGRYEEIMCPFCAQEKSKIKNLDKSMEKIKMSQLNLFQKMQAIYKQVDSVDKGARIQAGYGSYTAVLHDDVTRLLHKPMAELGIICVSDVYDHNLVQMEVVKKGGELGVSYRSEVSMKLILINADKPDEKLEITSHSFAIDSGDKSYGKAVSMATKYALLKAFMLESRDNEESRDQELQAVKSSQQSIKLASDKQKEIIKRSLEQQGKFSEKTQAWLDALSSKDASAQIEKIMGK